METPKTREKTQHGSFYNDFGIEFELQIYIVLRATILISIVYFIRDVVNVQSLKSIMIILSGIIPSPLNHVGAVHSFV